MSPASPPRRPRGVRLVAALGLAVVLPLAVGASGAFRLEAWREGPPPDRVGACGFGPTCRDAGCHASFPIGSATLAWDLELADPVPAPLPSLYVPGQAYDLLLSAADTDPATAAIGFELSAIADCPFQAPGGELLPDDPNRVRRFVDDATDVVHVSHDCTCPLETADCCGYVSPDGPALPTNRWRITWLAPPRGTGQVSLTLALNASNWDRTPEQDRIVLGERFIDEEPCPPRIADLRVELADCDGTGAPDVSLTWTDGGGATLVREGEPADLDADPTTWSEATACVALDPRPLVFYSVAEDCELGSEGVH